MANISQNIYNKINKIANIGEKLAQQYLVKKNYLIVKTNIKYRCGEIDIVAKKGKILIFIEVKTRTNWQYGYPEEAFNYQKQQKLAEAINTYLYKNNIQNNWQIDLITIDLLGKIASLRHYQAVSID